MIGSLDLTFPIFRKAKPTEIYLNIPNVNMWTPRCAICCFTSNLTSTNCHPKIILTFQGWFPVRVYWDTGRLGMKLAEQDGVLVVRTAISCFWVDVWVGNFVGEFFSIQNRDFLSSPPQKKPVSNTRWATERSNKWGEILK